MKSMTKPGQVYQVFDLLSLSKKMIVLASPPAEQLATVSIFALYYELEEGQRNGSNYSLITHSAPKQSFADSIWAFSQLHKE